MKDKQQCGGGGGGGGGNCKKVLIVELGCIHLGSCSLTYVHEIQYRI